MTDEIFFSREFGLFQHLLLPSERQHTFVISIHLLVIDIPPVEAYCLIVRIVVSDQAMSNKNITICHKPQVTASKILSLQSKYETDDAWKFLKKKPVKSHAKNEEHFWIYLKV